MQDELILRRWVAQHDRFSADLQRGMERLSGRLPKAMNHMRETYGALLRGAFAGAITVGLWAGMVSLAAPPASAAKPVDIVLALAIDGPAWRILA